MHFPYPFGETGLESPLRGGLCWNKRIRQNPEASSGAARPSLRWMSLATVPLATTAAFAGNGSARSTPKTKRGITALSSQVKRVARDKNLELAPHCTASCGSAQRFRCHAERGNSRLCRHTIRSQNRGGLSLHSRDPLDRTPWKPWLALPPGSLAEYGERLTTSRARWVSITR